MSFTSNLLFLFCSVPASLLTKSPFATLAASASFSSLSFSSPSFSSLSFSNLSFSRRSRSNRSSSRAFSSCSLRICSSRSLRICSSCSLRILSCSLRIFSSCSLRIFSSYSFMARATLSATTAPSSSVIHAFASIFPASHTTLRSCSTFAASSPSNPARPSFMALMSGIWIFNTSHRAVKCLVISNSGILRPFARASTRTMPMGSTLFRMPSSSLIASSSAVIRR
mmetsp:Transcript_111815/g.315856  ORF Transcript_111815/g.315856 Transcript_111815/m.315856 type:complete len:225 (-) Transcript_111815:269-943(-)